MMVGMNGKLLCDCEYSHGLGSLHDKLGEWHFLCITCGSLKTIIVITHSSQSREEHGEDGIIKSCVF